MKRAQRLVFWFLLGSVVLALAAACAKKEDVIVQTGTGKELSKDAIDADPIALLPPNAIGAMTVDAQALFASQFGARMLGIVNARSPIPAAAEFDPARDLTRAYVAFYSMQGADTAGVALGNFKPDKIEQAADQTPRTATGDPVVKSKYAGRTLYTANGIGFTVLTERTVLFGNETGIRRSLDRIREGRARRQLPAWMSDLLASPSAPLVGGADFTAQPVPAAAREQLAFLDGIRTASMVGNFQDPGLNLAGTLSYEKPEAATRGADNLRSLHDRLSTYGPLMALIGIPQPVRKLSAEAREAEVRFVIGIDGAAVAVLLEKAQAYLSAFGGASSGAKP